MEDADLENALKVFRVNTQLFPDAWNTYDSYGECLFAAGDTLNGMKAYAKSLELNPENNTARGILKTTR